MSKEGAHSSWQSMKYRCTNPKARCWHRYGGRGIKICERWLGPDGFANFLADMGERPEGKTLDRYPNNDGNYEPGNCRWATPLEQNHNRSRDGRLPAVAPTGRVTLAEASKTSGLSRQELHRRIKAGLLSGEQAENGVWTIAGEDAALLRRRPPSEGKRVAVMVRVPQSRYDAWARAVGGQAGQHMDGRVGRCRLGIQAEARVMGSGRKPTDPPRGRVTLQQAAEMSGLSYAEVHRRVSTGAAPAEQGEGGIWTMAASDARRLRRRQPTDDPRKAVMVRVPVDEYEAWRRAAGKRKVSSWLRALGDDASGYKSSDSED